MKKILAALALLTACLVPVAAAAPAHAGPLCDSGISCGAFLHYSPDDGYDAAIMIACNYNDVWGSSQLVYEGQYDRCHDVDAVYVRPGTNIICKNWYGGWSATYTADGHWYKITDNEMPICVNQLN